MVRSLSRFLVTARTLAAGLPLLLAAACETSTTKPTVGSNQAGSSSDAAAVPGDPAPGNVETGTFGPGGACDMQALMAQAENGCTNAGCHGARFQGNLDLLSPGVDQRLLGVASQSEACRGELLVDPANIDRSLLRGEDQLVDLSLSATEPTAHRNSAGHVCCVTRAGGADMGRSSDPGSDTLAGPFSATRHARDT